MRTQTIQAPMQVVQSTGDVMVVLADGSTRPVHQGEVLPAGSVLQLADNATLQLEPTTAATQPELVAPAAEAAAPQGTTAEIAAIQQALLQGVDPTMNLEATAAGGAPAAGGGGAGGSGNGGFVSIDRIGDATLATAGFDTTYQSAGLLDVTDPAGVAETVVVIPPPAMAPDPAALSETNLTTTGSGDVDLVNGSTAGGAPTSLTGNLNVDFAGDTGTVTFLSVDSQPALTSGGQPIVWTLSADGLTLVGSVGDATVLTVTLAADGSSYVVDLDGPLDHAVDALMMNFGVQAQNSAGDITTGEIVLTVEDDAPSATDEDPMEVDEGDFVVGQFDFVEGADGATVTAINGEPLIIGADGWSQVINGAQGELQVNADGRYIFTAADDSSHLTPDDYTFTVTDKDGDSATGTVTFDSLDQNEPSAEAGSGVVDEAALEDGSDKDSPNERTTGKLSFDGHGDAVVLTVEGTLITAADDSANGGLGTLIAGEYGNLYVTSNGSWTYDLVNNTTDHADPNKTGAEDQVQDIFNFSVSDGDGDTASSKLTINVNDDGPSTTDEDPMEVDEGDFVVGQFDFVEGADGATVTAINGEPLIIGADGWSQVINGAQGELQVNADGRYIFTAADDSSHLTPDDYTFTVTDKDGDSATGTVTFDSLDQHEPSAEAGSGTVDEAALDDGSHAVSTNERTSGTLSFNGNGDAVVLSVEGTAIIAANDGGNGNLGTLIAGEYGNLYVKSNGSWTYDLVDNTTDHTDPSKTGAEDQVQDIFDFSVRDGDGNTASSDLTINVNDDGPSASDEGTVNVNEGDFVTGTFDFVEGADGATVTAINGEPLIIGADGWSQVINGAQGELQVNADGRYIFTAADDSSHLTPDDYTFTVTDKDGDSATGTVTFDSLDQHEPSAEAGSGTVDEAALDDGSHAVSTNERTSGTLSFNGNGDAVVLSVEGTAIIAANDGGNGNLGTLIAGEYGNLYVKSNGSWTYDLVDNTTDHTDPSKTGAEDQVQDIFDFSVRDGDGNTASSDLTINVNDDGPSASDEGTVNVNEGDFVTGTFDFVEGADGATVTAINGENLRFESDGWSQVINGAQGELQVNADGRYIFTAADDSSHLTPDDYIFTVTDKDGDSATGTVTFDSQDMNEPSAEAGSGTVDEAALDDGSHAVSTNERTSGTLSFNGNGDAVVLSVEGTAIIAANDGGNGNLGTLIAGEYGNLYVKSNGSWTYDLVDNTTDHTDPSKTGAEDQVQDIFDFSVRDGDGNTASSDLTINVNDDGPSASDEGTVNVNEGDFVTGTFDFVEGADGATVTAINGENLRFESDGWSQVIEGAQGGLQVKADGSYRFTAADDSSHLNTDDYTFTVTDKDGDSATGTVTFDSQDMNEPSAEAGSGTVDEAALDDGSHAVSTNERTSGTLSFNGNGDAVVLSVEGTAIIAANDGGNGNLGTLIAGEYGNLYVKSNGSWTYDLVDNTTDHTDPSKTGAEDQVQDIFDFSVTDGDGDTASSKLTINVNDDGPSIALVGPAVVENSADAPDFLGTSALLMGADQPGHADLTANIAGWNGGSTTWGISTLTSGEHPIYYFVDPDDTSVLYAYTSPLAGPYNPATSDLIFTLTYGVDGHYTLNMDGTIDAPKHIYTDTFTENIGSNVDYLLVGSNGAFYKPSDTIPPSAKIVMTIDASGTSTVNSSMQGIAVDNGWITSAEALIFKFTNPVVSAQFSIDTQTGDATNMVTWTVHGMAADGTLTTQSGTTSFTDGDLKDIPTTLTHITQIDLSDESGSGYRVSGTNLVYRIEEEPVTTNLAVAIVDEDGDKASGTLAVTFTPPIEDLFVVGTNADDVTGSTVPYATPADFGAIEGGKGDDILVGDEGRSSLIGKNVNIILMLDTSGSMTDQIAFGSGTTSRINALRLAVTNLLNELASSHADNVRVDLISFNTTATSLGIFDLDLNNRAELDAALAKIGALTAAGNTNYEAALQAALNWVNTPSTDSNAMLGGSNVINQAIFISDGEPNSWLHAENTSLSQKNVDDGSSSSAIEQLLGTYDDFWSSHDDDEVSEVALLESRFGPIQAVGINVGTSALDILNQVEGEPANVNPDAATNITTAEQLDQVLADLNPEVQFSPAGRDTITGGDGNDLIFGDALFTDDLANAAGLDTAAGGGWQVFTELEAGEGEGSSYADWDRSDTLDYINTHQDELSQESGRLSGADILDGGAGNDVLFGQEGDDQLTGGTGNDTMSGGSGADTFIWLAADADGSEDVIKDFTIGEDKLDLQAVLDPTSDPLSDYLDISANTDGDAVVKVYSAGNASGGGDPDLTITLDGLGSDLQSLQDYLHDDGVIK